MALKPQDVLVALKLQHGNALALSYEKLAQHLGMSVAEVHAASKRLVQANLAEPNLKKSGPPKIKPKALEEFLIHGLKYVFYPEYGQLTRGMPTAYAAKPLDKILNATAEPPPVWPDPNGEVRGISLKPLYPSVPSIAKHDPNLYQVLALLDAIRSGRTRDREIAIKELTKYFSKIRP